jgi:hypothetical protein
MDTFSMPKVIQYFVGIWPAMVMLFFACIMTKKEILLQTFLGRCKFHLRRSYSKTE